MEPRYVYRDSLEDPSQSKRGGPDSGAEFELWQAVLALWSGKWLIIAGTSAAAAVALAITVALPKEYVAVATVLVAPPTLTNELRPASFSVEAYEQLAESDYIRSRVVQELRRTKVIGPADENIGSLGTILYASREPQKPYLPLVGLSVRANTPEMAQRVANTWAIVFAREERQLAAADGSAGFIVSEYPKAVETLTEQERRLAQIKDDHGRAMKDAQAQYAPEWKLAQLKAREELLATLQKDLADTRVNVSRAEQAMKQAEAELKRTPRVLTVAKSMTDDALWMVATQQQSGAQPQPGAAVAPGATNDALAKLRLQDEEVNPTYTTVANKLAEESVAHAGLAARRDALSREVDAVRADIDRLRTEALSGELAVAELKREQEFVEGVQTRSVQEAAAPFERLKATLGDARLTMADQNPRLNVGALAELPRSAAGPNVAMNVAIAAALGFFVSLIGVWVMRHLRTGEPAEEPPLALGT